MNLLKSLLILLTLAVNSGATAAEDPINTGTFNNRALGGYDAVAYFTQNNAVKGSSAYTSEYQGAEFRFSSAANKVLFDADPAAYTPQYGGYCAYAVSQGSTASGDPKLWKIDNGKLYLNYNKKVRETWLKDIPGFVALGDKNWPGVLE